MSENAVDSASHIKQVALRLFAEYGIDGVSVRQIAQAAGQKNHAALTYHFGSKDALIRALIIDGARAIDERRNAWLDRAEAKGGPHTLLDVMLCLVHTSIDHNPPAHGECYNRFLAALQLSHQQLFITTVAGRWNGGYQRCLDHVRRLMPDGDPRALNRQLVFMGSAIGGILSAREVQLADQSRTHPMWAEAGTLDQVAVALASLIQSVNVQSVNTPPRQ